ncbi:MAG: hypothetical protein J6S67_15735 [Methanobrevibacter sp.]|nr:hypothetical protein [Methanobrevibacter sp.]
MNHVEWMAIGALGFVFFILAVSTRRWVLMLLTFLWIVIGVLIAVWIGKNHPAYAFMFLIFWSIYPIGRSLRTHDD